MLTLFQRKRVPPPTGAPHAASVELPKGLSRPKSNAALLATPRRQKLLEHIWQRTSLSRAQFAALYRGPLDRYAELVQQFPASESHHHAYPGGMLDHGLEIVAYALKLRQSHLLPVGASPESQAAQSEAWTAGVAYAALLHDIGKIAVDLHVEYADGTAWHPWHGPLSHPYRFRYRKDREYRLHSAATGLLYSRLLDREILDWLSGFPDLWSSLLYVLAGQYEHAGMLGELVVQADQASVAQELGGDPSKAIAAPKHALQRKLLDGLRYLLKEEFKLNQPQASDGWLTQDALWLVSKTVSDKLRAHLLSKGIEGIPEKNTAVFNVLQDHGIAQATRDGKAIWKATVTGNNGWSHSFTFLKLAPALIWEAGDRPPAFAGTVRVEHADISQQSEAEASSSEGTSGAELSSSPDSLRRLSSPVDSTIGEGVGTLLDMLETAPAHAPVISPITGSPDPSESIGMRPLDVRSVPSAKIASKSPSGEHFIDWLRASIQSRKLIINDAKALVHTVADTAYLVSPGVFQRYAQERPEISKLARQEGFADWQWVQKRFERLQLHWKHASGLNIWTCEVTGPRKSRRLHGYLLKDARSFFVEMPSNNPYLKVLDGWLTKSAERADAAT